MIGRVLAMTLLAGASCVNPAPAGDLTGPLRTEWTVERTRGGHPQVAGYVHNDNGLRDGANVWVRVERLAPDGAVTEVYRRRLVGDVKSGGRLAFAVPVTAETASYRVRVDSVDWVDECR